jgi:small subunit ribosomal protein S3
MGQKVHPYGFRLGIVTDWKSRWYSDKDFARQILQDYRIREYLTGELRRGAVSRIDIERIGDKKVQIDIHTARPGVVIGRGGSEAERLRSGLEKLTDRMVKFNVIEVPNPEVDAQLLSQSVADQLEGRVSFRRAMKRTVQTAMKAGAQGVRVQCSGRLGGSDMGRREWYREGRVPLHTLRADVDYGQATAVTTVGAIGVKVWVYKGDIVAGAGPSREKIAAEARLAAGGPAKRRAPAKARAEQAAGEGREPRLIEAGGGKRLVEAGGGKRREGGKRPEAPTKKLRGTDAQTEFEAARDDAGATAPDPAVEADAPESEASAPPETEAVVIEPAPETEAAETATPDPDAGDSEPAPEAEAAAPEAPEGEEK